MVDIKMLSAGQRAERYEPFNIRRERRVSSSHFVRSAEYRRRNDFPRLGRNTLERNVLCRAVRGNVFQRTPVSSSADSQARAIPCHSWPKTDSKWRPPHFLPYEVWAGRFDGVIVIRSVQTLQLFILFGDREADAVRSDFACSQVRTERNICREFSYSPAQPPSDWALFCQVRPQFHPCANPSPHRMAGRSRLWSHERAEW